MIFLFKKKGVCQIISDTLLNLTYFREELDAAFIKSFYDSVERKIMEKRNVGNITISYFFLDILH